MESYFLIDAVLGGGLAHIVANRIAVRYMFLLRPWPPCEAEGVEVGIGADAWVAEEVPCASYAATRLEDGVAGGR